MNVTGGGRGNRRKPMAEINVVPYIDVSLVLLIIFMVTTPLLQTGVDVDLEKAESKAVNPTANPPVVVTITRDGQVRLNVGDQKDELVDEASLQEKVLNATQGKDVPVLVRGDRSVEYGTVLHTMAALKRAGVAKVGLMTQSPE